MITIVTLPISNSELKKPNDQLEIPWERKENYSITWKTRRNLCHHFFIQVNCSQRKDTKAECLSCCPYRIFSPVTPYTINSEWHSHVNTCVCVIMHYNQGRQKSTVVVLYVIPWTKPRLCLGCNGPKFLKLSNKQYISQPRPVVLMIACRLVGARPLPEPMLVIVHWTLRKKHHRNCNRNWYLSFKIIHVNLTSAIRWPFGRGLNLLSQWGYASLKWLILSHPASNLI